MPNADAVAVAEDRIVAVGASTELLACRGAATHVVDAEGGTVTPGFTDAHIHLQHWARARQELDLRSAATRDEAVTLLRTFSGDQRAVDVLVGRGWDANAWTEAPERGALDAVISDRPVVLYSRDFHNVWLNSAALRASGVGKKTPNPAGGVIEHDAAGEPTGVLRENATRLIVPLEAAMARDDATRVDGAIRALHALGVTAIHDFEGAEAHRLLRHAADGDGPRLRVLMHLPHSQLEDAIALGLESGLGDTWFRLGAVKLFADGTLGSRTASLLEPYDDTHELGMDVLEPRQLREIVQRAGSNGWSTAIHAIGDRAVRSSLDAFAASGPDRARLRLPPRIEHAQLVHPEDVPRFAALGVVASMQPIHCISDISLAERWWGSRRQHSYPWRSLLEHGAVLAFGSDAPVESPSIAHGLHAAVARRAPGSDAAYVPEQAITLDAALTAYTEIPARIAGWWPEVGTLDVGSCADLVIWDRDLHDADRDASARAKPRLTVLGGIVVHATADLEGSSMPRVTRSKGEGRP